MRLTLGEFLAEGYDLNSLKKRKIALTDEERKKVMDSGAVWHFGNKDKPTPAVWKAKTSSGKIVYACNTHRAFQVKNSLKDAIDVFHSFIKDTA